MGFLARLEEKRLKALQGVTDPSILQKKNENFDKLLESTIKRVRSPFDAQIETLGQERDNDKLKIDQDLARIAAELVQELRQGNPNSYLGRLRLILSV